MSERDPIAEFMARAPFAEVWTSEGPTRAWGANPEATVSAATEAQLHADRTGFVPVPPAPPEAHRTVAATGPYKNTDDCRLVRRLVGEARIPGEMSLATLAGECGVCETVVGRWYAGKQLPQPEDRPRLHRTAHEWLTRQERAPFDVPEI